MCKDDAVITFLASEAPPLLVLPFFTSAYLPTAAASAEMYCDAASRQQL